MGYRRFRRPLPFVARRSANSARRSPLILASQMICIAAVQDAHYAYFAYLLYQVLRAFRRARLRAVGRGGFHKCRYTDPRQNTNTAEYRATGRPRSFRSDVSVANLIFYHRSVILRHSTMKYKNGRIPSHRASQKLSIGSFGSKFNSLPPVGVLIRLYDFLV